MEAQRDGSDPNLWKELLSFAEWDDAYYHVFQLYPKMALINGDKMRTNWTDIKAIHKKKAAEQPKKLKTNTTPATTVAAANAKKTCPICKKDKTKLNSCINKCAKFAAGHKCDRTKCHMSHAATDNEKICLKCNYSHKLCKCE
jgi:hypothetical protein